MDKIAKTAIHDLVLSLRKILEAEVERELGRYGIYTDRSWIRVDELPRLNEQEKKYIRPRIEAAIQRERDGGMDTAQAVSAFIRETAYTHLNRLLGLKCMEVRGLIKETITTRERYSGRSQRHRDFLDEHPEAHRLPDRGLVLMLHEACSQISQQIGVVFDPDSDYSLVWPRHTVLKDCVEAINGLDGQVANRRGEVAGALPSVYADDTVLGWVYQYFQEEEKARVFAGVNKNKKKIGGADIIPATTAYTERYMVQFLVENSLGALWMEMYPESDLYQGWEYFVDDPNLVQEDGSRQRGRDPMPVSEITLLDPACGSGHFLLYAFDLFAQMYEAEASMQNKRIERTAITRSILRHNLYGIDIDLRSIQLSALNLYMKACTYAGVPLDGLQNGGAVQMNLVCADIVLKRGHEYNELLARFKGDPLTQSLIQTIWRGLENARELGSLLKIDEQIDELIRRKRQAEKGTFWEHPEALWDQWKKDFVETLIRYIDRASESHDTNLTLFGKEAIKGLGLLDLLTKKYSVVVANPPYMGDLQMSEILKKYIIAHYERSSSDLYAVFIDRCLYLTELNSYTAMVTQQGFMFNADLVNLRIDITTNRWIRTLSHLGPRAFESIGGEKVDTAMFSFQKSNPWDRKCVFFRLLDARTSEKKDKFLKRLIRDNGGDELFVIAQRDFTFIEGMPWVYWITPVMLSAFKTFGRVTKIIEPKAGLSTGENPQFIRYWWEIPKDNIGKIRWFPCMSGGSYTRWYSSPLYIIDWEDNGKRIKNFTNADGKVRSAVRNEEYYFKEGLIFLKNGSVAFSPWYNQGSIFLDTNRYIYVKDNDEFFVLGFLNSAYVDHALNLLNPTGGFTHTNIERIPYKKVENEKIIRVISHIAKYSYERKFELLGHHVEDIGFTNTGLETVINEYESVSLNDLYKIWIRKKEYLLAELEINKAFLDMCVFKAYSIDQSQFNKIMQFETLSAGWYPQLEGYSVIHSPFEEVREFQQKLSSLGSTPEDILNIKQNLRYLYVEKNKSIEEVSSQLRINPTSCLSLLHELDLVNLSDFENEIENLLTHRIWELGKQDPDGILPYDEGIGSPSLLQQVRGEIEALFGTDRAVDIETEMDGILGKGGLAAWLGDPFFKKHVSQFKKRPILWQVTSPGKNFRILIYYHKIDHDTLPKVRSLYLWPLLERARTQLRVEKKQAPLEMKAIARLEEYIADLEECDRRLEHVIQGSVKVKLPEWAVGPYRDGKPPYNPDLNDGVRVNILPLQAAGLLPIKKVVEE